MCGVCNGKGKVMSVVIQGAYEIKACPICKPKNKAQLDREMAEFNERLRAAMAKQEANTHGVVHSA
jgi:hypothetical protein